MSVAGVAAAVHGREVSAREVVTDALERIEAGDPALNAFVAVDAERALADADAVDADPAGPLAGVPLAVKDLEDTVGYRTTRGSLLGADARAASVDSLLVARLKAAGCVVVGKTNTPEMGWTADTYNDLFGPTRNPWDTSRSPGGSSGGSAAALAGGLVPLATGSDAGGSMRIPAAACGIAGFKPTLGAVGAGGAVSWSDLSIAGPMCATVADTALVLGIVAGPDPRDIRSFPLELEGTGALPERVLWCRSLDGGEVDDEVAAVAGAAARSLVDAGVDVVPIGPILDHDPIGDFLTLANLYVARSLADVRGTERWELVGAGLRRLVDDTVARTSALRVLAAQEAGFAINGRLVDALETHGAELLLCPTTAGQTPRCEEPGTINGKETDGWVRFTYPWNLARVPAGSVCAGLTGDGMPVGLQVVGPRLADGHVLALMALVEELVGVRTPPPLG